MIIERYADLSPEGLAELDRRLHEEAQRIAEEASACMAAERAARVWEVEI